MPRYDPYQSSEWFGVVGTSTDVRRFNESRSLEYREDLHRRNTFALPQGHGRHGGHGGSGRRRGAGDLSSIVSPSAESPDRHSLESSAQHQQRAVSPPVQPATEAPADHIDASQTVATSGDPQATTREGVDDAQPVPVSAEVPELNDTEATGASSTTRELSIRDMAPCPSQEIRPISNQTFNVVNSESFGQWTRDISLSHISSGLPGNEARSIDLPEPFTSNRVPRNPLSASLRRTWRSIRPCHKLIALGVLTIIGSLIPALWRSADRNDLSGGFNLGQYILGVGVFVVGGMAAIHNKTCTCWQ